MGKNEFMEAGMLVRVRKQDIQISDFAKPDGLNVCLECWKSYMLGDDRDLSASHMNLKGGAEEDDDDDDDKAKRDAYQSDIYAEQRKEDMKIGAATDAMIDSLRPLHSSAIRKKCGIASVWRFPSADFLSTLEDAERELTTKLKNNIATATQFD